MDQDGDSVFLEIGGERFPMQRFNTGYCPGCVSRVPPGQTITALISYSEFRLPPELYGEPKKLIFQPLAYRC